MIDENQTRLYRKLGYSGPLSGANRESASLTGPGDVTRENTFAAAASNAVPEHGAEPPPLDEDELEILAERLREEPDVILKRARQGFDSELTEEELRAAISRAQSLLRAPKEGLRFIEAAEAHEAAAAPRLPPEFFQDDLGGWDPNDPLLRIDPTNTRFETKADAANWVLFSAGPWIGSNLSRKAPFRWHGRHPSGFVYEREAPAPGKPLPIAMVSDFGTGLYHSNYIAKTLREHAYPYVIHGGDVYYAGRASEFATNFRPQLDPLVKQGAQVFTLNANHEMYSSGKPYFEYIADRKRAAPAQLQEGSYFCLRFGKLFQVIGIDTAYFRNARYDEPELLQWLERVLVRGRQDGAVNVLFSSNEPYDYGSSSTKALLGDLGDLVVERQLVDLWFWGNTHHCALYDRTPALPFIGTCIGHGGYPYSRMTAGKPSAAPVRFLETAARFPAYTNVRQDRGNNGFCAMTLSSDHRIELKYIDWTRRQRCRAILSRSAGAFGIERLEL